MTGTGAKAASPAPLTLAPCPALTQPCAQHRAAGSGQNPHCCSSPCSACSPAPRHCITSSPATPRLIPSLHAHCPCTNTCARSPHRSPQPPCCTGPASIPFGPRLLLIRPRPLVLPPFRPVPTCPPRAGPSHPFGCAPCSRVPLCPLLGARRGPGLGAAQPPAPGPTAITTAVRGGLSPLGAARGSAAFSPRVQSRAVRSTKAACPGRGAAQPSLESPQAAAALLPIPGAPHLRGSGGGCSAAEGLAAPGGYQPPCGKERSHWPLGRKGRDKAPRNQSSPSSSPARPPFCLRARAAGAIFVEGGHLAVSTRCLAHKPRCARTAAQGPFLTSY